MGQVMEEVTIVRRFWKVVSIWQRNQLSISQFRAYIIVKVNK